MPYNEKSRANLAPQFKPGQSGNPAGSKRAGASIVEWINVLANEELSPDELRAIAENPRSTPAKVIAARRILGAMSDNARYGMGRDGAAYNLGSDPEPGRDFDRVLDRLTGKPMQSVQHIAPPPRSLEEAMADLRALLEANPELHNLLAQRLGESIMDVPASLPEAQA